MKKFFQILGALVTGAINVLIPRMDYNIGWNLLSQPLHRLYQHSIFPICLKAKETLTQAKQLSKFRYLTIGGYETNSGFGF